MKITGNLPLLLLDNSSMMSVINQGVFKCYNMSLTEAATVLENIDSDNVLRCFNDGNLENIIYDYLSIPRKNIPYKRIRNMFPGQDALVFKLYITPSETQPVIQADDGVEAKKIQNVYIYCQYLSRVS